METSGRNGAVETVATREWVILEVEDDGVLVDQLPDGGRARLDRDLLPDDVAEGDRFRVVAQVDRRAPREDADAPAADTSGRDGESRAEEPDVSAESALPDALDEALRNLT